MAQTLIADQYPLFDFEDPYPILGGGPAPAHVERVGHDAEATDAERLQAEAERDRQRVQEVERRQEVALVAGLSGRRLRPPKSLCSNRRALATVYVSRNGRVWMSAWISPISALTRSSDLTRLHT